MMKKLLFALLLLTIPASAGIKRINGFEQLRRDIAGATNYNMMYSGFPQYGAMPDYGAYSVYGPEGVTGANRRSGYTALMCRNYNTSVLGQGAWYDSTGTPHEIYAQIYYH